MVTINVASLYFRQILLSHCTLAHASLTILYFLIALCSYCEQSRTGHIRTSGIVACVSPLPPAAHKTPLLPVTDTTGLPDVHCGSHRRSEWLNIYLAIASSLLFLRDSSRRGTIASLSGTTIVSYQLAHPGPQRLFSP